MNTTDSSAATGAAATPDTETAPRVVAGQADDAGLDGEEAGEEEREEEEEAEGEEEEAAAEEEEAAEEEAEEEKEEEFIGKT